MDLFNRIASAIFGVLLAPFGEEHVWSAWIDLLVWSIGGGIVALLVYKLVSNQKGITRAKNEIKVHLLEIRLFKDDILGVLSSTGKILGKNAIYLGHNLLPMVVMIVPMMAILVQLVALYAFDPVEVDQQQLLKLKLDNQIAAVAGITSRDVTLELPAGVVLDAPPVPTAQGEIAWRLRATAPGDYVLKIHVGDEMLEKRLAVGGEPRRVPVKRTKTWKALLYPAEPPVPSDSAVLTATFTYPARDLGWMPGGELGILLVFFGLSLAAGIALKGVFKVTL